MDESFMKVRDYIYDNEDASIEEVAKKTEVPASLIMQLLRDGRLQLRGPGGEGALVCEVCKCAIESGRMCLSCQKDISKTVQDSIKQPEPKKEEKAPTKSTGKGKMHTRS